MPVFVRPLDPHGQILAATRLDHKDPQGVAFLAEPQLSNRENVVLGGPRWNHVAVQLALPLVELCTLRNCKAGFAMVEQLKSYCLFGIFY